MARINGVDANGEVNDVNIDTGGALLTRSKNELDGGAVPLITQYVSTTLPAGTSTVDVYSVPSAYVVNLDAISINYTGTVAGVQVRMFIRTGSVNYYLFSLANITSNIYYPYNMNILMDDTCILRAIIINATLNDDLVISAFLRRVK